MKAVFICLAILIGLVTEVWAFRCQSGRIVDIGYSKAQVLSYCGSPRLVIDDGVAGSYKRTGKKQGTYRTKPVEIWVYQPPQVIGTFGYRLTFDGDTLIEIQHISN
jgi:hypothetical protein